MQIEKHLSGLLTGIVIAGLCWLALVVVFPAPTNAPPGTVKMYIPPKSMGQDYRPTQPFNEDEHILPQSTEKTREATAPKTSEGSTEYFGNKKDLNLPPVTVIPQDTTKYPDPPKEPIPHQASPDDGSTFYFGYDSGWQAPEVIVPPTKIVDNKHKKKDTSHESFGVMEGQFATTCIVIGGCRVAAKRTFI